MQEYAKIKCQELLEIVAEKEKIKYEMYEEIAIPYVVKDSILNAIDLDSFID